MTRELAKDRVGSNVDEPTASCHVAVVGRLGSRVDRRELPSGDEVTTFTIVVDRPAASRSRAPSGEGAAVRVDSIPCQSFRATVARRAEALPAGTWVRAQGVLRRRFWRAGAGVGSAMEVQVTRLDRVTMPR
ncbi:MAG: single-stranded DNA-binding protein [Actinomycetota bacterium]|nr:single-stranded DNA-binding protein [Actinomycetota bacterium]